MNVENDAGTSPFQVVMLEKALLTSANILRQKPIGGSLGEIANERVRYQNIRFLIIGTL
jgi:hypothetical protein